MGFDSERNAVIIITNHDVVDVPESSKWDVAQRVIETAIKLRASARSLPAKVIPTGGA